MLMTPPLVGAMLDEQNLQAGLENKKAASCSGSRMGNRAAGCHFRPYSFASSPFDDFAEMKNSTRKIACQPLSAPPLDGPPTTANPDLREGGKGSRRSLLTTRFSQTRAPRTGSLPITRAKQHRGRSCRVPAQDDMGLAPVEPPRASVLKDLVAHTKRQCLRKSPQSRRQPAVQPRA